MVVVEMMPPMPRRVTKPLEGAPTQPVVHLGHARRVVIISVEFTIPDDAYLGAAVGGKHSKYDPWL